MEITVVVVPHICDPIPAQPIDLTRQHFSHLADLELADSSEIDRWISGFVPGGINWY